MPEVDFQPFAVAGGANVESQAAYLADSQFAQGFQSGVARSAIANKALRQATIMASVLAQFIANEASVNAIDDGTTATLLANLLLAIRASGSGYFQPLLAFTPVQQGTGVGQLGNTVKLGWDGTAPRVTIDTSDQGEIAMRSWVSALYQPAGTYLTGIQKSGLASAGASGSNTLVGNVTFPAAFPGGCTFALAIPATLANSTYGYMPTTRTVSISTSGAVFNFDTLTGASSPVVTFNQTFYFNWLAFGF